MCPNSFSCQCFDNEEGRLWPFFWLLTYDWQLYFLLLSALLAFFNSPITFILTLFLLEHNSDVATMCPETYHLFLGLWQMIWAIWYELPSFCCEKCVNYRLADIFAAALENYSYSCMQIICLYQILFFFVRSGTLIGSWGVDLQRSV